MASEKLSLSAAMLEALREYVRFNLAYARYKVGSAYYRAELNEKQVLPDGRVSITFEIDHTLSGNINITEVQLFNRNGVMWANKAVSITRLAVQEGIMYRCRFTVIEET